MDWAAKLKQDIVDTVYQEVVAKAVEKALPEKKDEPLFEAPVASEIKEYTAVPVFTPAPVVIKPKDDK
jgi:hypothetical protein